MEGKVPITFNYNGIDIKGSFNPVIGFGGNVWHLMINERYSGRLRLNDDGWFFDGNNYSELGDYFGEYLTLWYG